MGLIIWFEDECGLIDNTCRACCMSCANLPKCEANCIGGNDLKYLIRCSKCAYNNIVEHMKALRNK